MSDAQAIDPGPRPELTWLPVDRLEVDPSYQRRLDLPAARKHIARIAANFRWAMFQAVLATPATADRWLVIDGQHRVAAAAAAGIALVPAVVIHGLDRAAAAEAFIGANRNRIAVTAQALFHARLGAGDAAAATVKRLCDRAGIELLPYALSAKLIPAGKTTAATALLDILRVHGEDVAAETIRGVAECCGATPGALRGAFFAGAARYLADGGSAAGLRRALAAIGVAGLEAIAYQLTSNSAIAPIAQALHAATAAERARVAAAAAGAPEEGPRDPMAAPAALRGARFEDEPRARRDPGSPGRLGRAEPFGRSATGSSLA